MQTTGVPIDITRLAGGVVQWLVSRQMRSGGIRGEGEIESPSDHYAHSFAALAIAIVAEAKQCRQMWQQAEQAAYYTIRLPAKTRSEQEFNSLALLMLAEIARESKIAPSQLRSDLESLIGEPAFLYDGGRQVSNNWLAMRSVCFLMRAHLTGDKRSQQRGDELVSETLGWQLNDGVFVDYPRKARSEFATPLTYHAKMCAMLAFAAQYSQRAEILPALDRGLRALVGLMSPGGECLYYGRSCNSLFGMAAAYYALAVAQTRIPDGDWGAAFQNVGSRIERLREADGHLRLTDARDEAKRSGWDVYYHIEVYNAYAAALLLSTAHTPPEHMIRRFDEARENENQVFNLPDAGFVTVRGPGFFAAVSTKGQCVLDGSSLFCDMRYSGMQPLLIETEGLAQVPEPPLRWKDAKTKVEAVSPRLVGFMPFVNWRGLDYCARIFEDISVTTADAWYGVCGNGPAIALSLPSRALRIIRRFRGKVTGSGDLAFTPTPLPRFRMTRAVIVFPINRALLFIDAFEGEWPEGATWYGPNARMLPGTDMIVRSVLDHREIRGSAVVPTSRGEAEFCSCEPPAILAPASGCVSAVICSSEAIDARVQVDDHRLNITVGNSRLCLNLRTKTIESVA